MVLLLYSTLLFSINIHPPVTAIKPGGWSGWKMAVLEPDWMKLKIRRIVTDSLFDSIESDE